MVVIVAAMKLRTWYVQEPPSTVLDELFQTFYQKFTLGYFPYTGV